MKIKLLLLALSLFFTLSPSLSYGGECKGKTVNITLSRLSSAEPTIYSNGYLRISLGTKEGDLVDSFTLRNQVFNGVLSSTERVDDSDTRAWVLRKIFPRELEPSQYYLTLYLSDSARESIKGKDLTKVTVTIKSSGRNYTGSFWVHPDPSWDCR